MSNITVIGTDGKKPDYDPKGRWTILNLKELYIGQEGANKYVGKVGDLVYDEVYRKYYRIIDLDLNTLIPTYVSNDEADIENNSNVLIGTGVQPVTIPAYLDTSQLPFQMSVDARHYVNGAENMFARVFRGTDTTSNGQVISATFNGSTYLDDRVDLEMSVYDDHTNLAQKVVPTFNTTANMPNGEICTLVIYNAQNNVTNINRLEVIRTAHIKPVNAAQRYIVGITMRSAFSNPADPYVLDMPLNAPVGALNLTGVVHYSDGSERTLPVDGSKFSLHGLETFIATRPGQTIPLVLNYRLDPGEFSYGAISADGKKITEPYRLVTTFPNGVYSPVLFGYPRWVTASQAYVMRWWLMDLNRETMFDVTGHVQYNESSDVYDGNAYDTMQFLSVRLNLASVSGAYPTWLHTQNTYLKLMPPVTNRGIWEVGPENVAGTFYGTDLTADTTLIDQNNFEVNISNHYTTRDEWLQNLYYKARPVFTLYREVRPPEPTHFTVITGVGTPQTFSVQSWNQMFRVNTNIAAAGNLVIRWDRILDNNQVLQLATTELPLNFL